MLSNKALTLLLSRSNTVYSRPNIISYRFLTKETLPDKTKYDGQIQEKEPERPLVVPTKHAQLARIPVEYHGVSPANFNDETIWLPLFIWPHHTHFRTLFRFKLYLSIGSLTFCGHSIYDLFSGNPDAPILRSVSLAVLALTSLSLTGALSKKLIGRIYISEDEKNLRVGRFTFYGFRRDIVVPMDCVIPLTELNEDNRKLFVQMRFQKPDDIDLAKDAIEFYEQQHLVPLKLGGVTDARLFEKILGRILTKKKLSQYL